MSWRKYFTPVRAEDLQPKSNTQQIGRSAISNKFASYLGEVYSGQPNRVDRYLQYDQMDQDAEINQCLDTIAEFCTQFKETDNLPFQITYREDPTEAEVNVLEQSLKQWSRINDWDKRIWRTVRSTLKYGDQFFIRDPETYEWIWVNPAFVTKVIINDTKGRVPEQYLVKNLQLDLINKVVTDQLTTNVQAQGLSAVTAMTKAVQPGQAGAFTTGRANQGTQVEFPVDASHVIHLSMTEGMDVNYPFGTSILDSVFKVYQQKALLEDAILIYRVQRAPERRVFYIDVGNMPSHLAMQFVERVKNEIHQRRIPSRGGGGQTVMDSSYNPLSIMEDYFFAQTSEGRGSKVEVLPGGDNLGQIDDLKYFNNKLMRGLRIPSSYIMTGPEDGTTTYNDGRLGTAFIQEYRFNKYCQRIQNMLATCFDQEFKLFLKRKGVEIDASTFDITFNEPQSFGEYREIELNNQRLTAFAQVQEVAYLSRRFVMKKYLGLTDDEIKDNEDKWQEENADQVGVQPVDTSDLNAVGVRPPLVNPLQDQGTEGLGPEVEPGEIPAPPAEGGAGPLAGGPGAGPAPTAGGIRPAGA